jgi:hypothetical protein
VRGADHPPPSRGIDQKKAYDIKTGRNFEMKKRYSIVTKYTNCELFVVGNRQTAWEVLSCGCCGKRYRQLPCCGKGYRQLSLKVLETTGPTYRRHIQATSHHITK